MTRSARRLLSFLVVAALVLPSVPSDAQTPAPYHDPPFTCDVIDYGMDAPPIPGPGDDPLCVRYDKTNITASTLEAVDFLAAEPGRIAIVAAKCSFWQQDEWAVRLSPDTPILVEWSGSYWYDASSGSAGGILRDLQVGGQPASADAFVEAVRPIVGDEQADDFASFADDGGGGGLTMALPEGFAFEECAAGAGADDNESPVEEDSETPDQDDDPSLDESSSPGAQSRSLPATGDATGLALAIGAAVAGLVVARALRRNGAT